MAQPERARGVFGGSVGDIRDQLIAGRDGVVENTAAKPTDQEDPSATNGEPSTLTVEPPTLTVEPPDEESPGSCAAIALEAQSTARPVDVILVIDNSGSMADEIAAVERNINVNFANILRGSGLDFRVILFGRYDTERPTGDVSALIGESLGVCIDAPLGPEPACAERGDDDEPHNPTSFYHFNYPVSSSDSFCKLAASATSGPEGIDDPSGVMKAGWTGLLREEAFKTFAIISDDTMWGCFNGLHPAAELAQIFDDWLLENHPEHFGNALQRRYVWHSIVGVQDKGGEAYQPDEPITGGRCGTAQSAAEEYQHLSVLTGGLRYPVCSFESYDVVFQRMAERVIEESRVPCNWGLPSPPPGQDFDPSLVNVNYTRGSGEEIELVGVGSAAECGEAEGWHYDDPSQPTSIVTCPTTCAQLTNDVAAKVDVQLGCATRVPVVR